MKDRNKIIFRAFIIASAVIMLAQTVTLVTHLDSHRYFGLIIAAIEIITVALLAYCTLHPELNRNYKFKKSNGQWNWERVTYAPDPDGMRYISAGVGSILVALLFFVVAGSKLWPDIVTEERITIAIIALLIPFCTVYCVVENSLRKKSKN